MTVTDMLLWPLTCTSPCMVIPATIFDEAKKAGALNVWPLPETFWKTAKGEERGKELEYVKRKAEPVLEYWKETVGKWR